MGFIFKIDTGRLNRLLVATGIKQFNTNRISASSTKWRSANSFSNWSVRLVFVGARGERDLTTFSSFGLYNPMINKVFGSQPFSTSGIKDAKAEADVKVLNNLKDTQLDVKGNFNSLLSVLEIFDLDKDQLSELEDYLKIVGHLFNIAKFGVNKKDQNKMISSIKKEFKNIGVKVTTINGILEDVLNKDKNRDLERFRFEDKK